MAINVKNNTYLNEMIEEEHARQKNFEKAILFLNKMDSIPFIELYDTLKNEHNEIIRNYNNCWRDIFNRSQLLSQASLVTIRSNDALFHFPGKDYNIHLPLTSERYIEIHVMGGYPSYQINLTNININRINQKYDNLLCEIEEGSVNGKTDQIFAIYSVLKGKYPSFREFIRAFRSVKIRNQLESKAREKIQEKRKEELKEWELSRDMLNKREIEYNNIIKQAKSDLFEFHDSEYFKNIRIL